MGGGKELSLPSPPQRPTDYCNDVISALQDIGIHSLSERHSHACTHSPTRLSVSIREVKTPTWKKEKKKKKKKKKKSLSRSPLFTLPHSEDRRGGTTAPPHLTHVISLTAGFLRRPLPAEKERRPFTTFRELKGELPRSPPSNESTRTNSHFPLPSPLSIE